VSVFSASAPGLVLATIRTRVRYCTQGRREGGGVARVAPHLTHTSYDVQHLTTLFGWCSTDRFRYEKTGKFEGLPSLGVHTQDLVNASLRKYAFGADTKHNDGVLIQKIQPFSSAKNAGVKEGDILMAIDGNSVSQEGEVVFRGHERVGYEFLISKRPIGDQVKLSLLRKGEDGLMAPVEIDVTLMMNFALVRPFCGPRRFILSSM
jgi:hypothetical protein